MLEVLCGSKNIQKILLFLFVNGKCYGTQLHRALNAPLTPLQNALQRLEKGGVIISDCIGKTRLYQFNPNYPLLGELEGLLKKAYTLLSIQEKKCYYVFQEEKGGDLPSQKNRQQLLLHLWKRLKSVTRLTFHAKTRSKEPVGWERQGRAEVVVTEETGNVLLLNEKGTWRAKETGIEVSFSNVFRWTMDRQAGLLSLEHLRRGPEHPVFLFYLASAGPHSFASVDSHLCQEDAYFGQISLDPQHLRFNWRVIGPKKNEEMQYYYS